MISGHWEETAFTASKATAPATIFDYYGFPPHTYALSYPAPASPELAKRVVALLKDAGLPARTDSSRGFDHGVFVPFLLIDPAEHLAAGKALAALREEGILIIGSGMSYHNMHAFRTPAATQPSLAFDDWLTEAVEGAPQTRWDEHDAPAGRSSHPREEHLLPLMMAAGAGADAIGSRQFTDTVMMAQISAFRFG